MTPFRRRVMLLCAAVATLLCGVGWSAFTVWRELGTLRARLTDAEFQSFRIAGELQSKVLGVNSALLGYAISSQERDWQRFENDRDALNGWIDLQRDALKTPQEKRILGNIDTEYDRYMAVANAVRTEHSDHSGLPAASLRQLDEASKRMFILAGHLADAHRAALGDLLGESQRDLKKLEILFGAGFALVVVMVAWGTRLVFRETITPLRRQLISFQELVERHEKLASLGVLAAGVAHEIRNPLTALKTRTYILRKKLPEEAPALKDAAIIEQEIRRLERIVGDFLLFARPGEPRFANVDPSSLLCEIHQLLSRDLASKEIVLAVETLQTATSIQADVEQLKQVLINLVRNAEESIGHGGKVTLRALRDRLPIDGITKDVLVLEVQDTGSGIPLDVQARLFDPFFTTKPAGTGLGLSIAMRILERHGGTLEYQTVPGKGTTFGIVLPASASATEPVGVENPSALSEMPLMIR